MGLEKWVGDWPFSNSWYSVYTAISDTWTDSLWECNIQRDSMRFWENGTTMSPRCSHPSNSRLTISCFHQEEPPLGLKVVAWRFQMRIFALPKSRMVRGSKGFSFSYSQTLKWGKRLVTENSEVRISVSFRERENIDEWEWILYENLWTLEGKPPLTYTLPLGN